MHACVDTNSQGAKNAPAVSSSMLLSDTAPADPTSAQTSPVSLSLSGFSSPEADFIVHHGDRQSLGAALFVAMEAPTAGRYACTR